MKAEFFANLGLSGATLAINKGERAGFAETSEIKNALAVVSGAVVWGYVLGSEAALIKACLARGLILYCLYAGEKEVPEEGGGAAARVDVYLVPKRI